MSSSEEDEQKKKEEKRRQDELRQQIDVNGVWNQLDIDFDSAVRTNIERDERPCWKTVRIFVSSTFKDFHQEREVLIKEVFADLRAWCEERRLHLIDCDLRWGVPKETTSEVTLKTCLEEITRCYQNNKAPYFLNLICKRIGWIPLDEDLPPKLLKEYGLVFGLSVTEMEIVYAALRIDNPNALFLIRDDSFLGEIEDEDVKREFVDELQPKAEEKLQVLKDKIQSRYQDNRPEERVITYKCKYVKGERLYTEDGNVGRPKLELDEKFSSTVFDFFKKQIELQYPPPTAKTDEYEDARSHHRTFIESRCNMIIGREDVLKQISDYIDNDSEGPAMLVVGKAGSGKSSILAKAVSDRINSKRKLSSCDSFIFFHFVGAVPNSTSLLMMLRRFLTEVKIGEDLPETLEETIQTVKVKLCEEAKKPVVIFIDAVNQLDKDCKAEEMLWLPEKLSSNVRCILSMIDESHAHKNLMMRGRCQPLKITIPELSKESRMKIVKEYLQQFNKKLEPEQFFYLLDKTDSTNPLWLRIACEELRVFGDFGTITDHVKNLQPDLHGLLKQVLERFERETDKVLLESTLCLLEVSKAGLLESELLEILAEKENMVYSNTSEKKSPRGVVERGRRLPSMEWAMIYRKLKFFLRPFGNPSEGRLDFYHRTLSKVVSEKYFYKSGKDEIDQSKLQWWHQKLADFFVRSGTPDRTVEEYPHHLLMLKDLTKDRRYSTELQHFLVDPPAFKRLYDHEFSGTLLYYWRESGDTKYDQLATSYVKSLDDMLRERHTHTNEELSEKFENVSRLLTQAGKYKEGLKVADDCLKIIEGMDDSLEKKEKMMYLYGHKAHCKCLLLPPMQDSNQISDLEEIIELHQKAMNIIYECKLDRKDKKYKRYLALQLTQTAFARAGIASRLSSSFFDKMLKKKRKDTEIEIGRGQVEKAITYYREIGDFGHELIAQFTMAELHIGDADKQLEIYKKAISRCVETFGPHHQLMCRLCFNTGIVYEDKKDYEDAYSYFRRAYDVAMIVLGRDHTMTQKYRRTLKEGKYATIANKRNERVD